MKFIDGRKWIHAMGFVSPTVLIKQIERTKYKLNIKFTLSFWNFSNEWDSRVVNNLEDSYGQEWVIFDSYFRAFQRLVITYRHIPIERFSNTHAKQLSLPQLVCIFYRKNEKSVVGDRCFFHSHFHFSDRAMGKSYHFQDPSEFNCSTRNGQLVFERWSSFWDTFSRFSFQYARC